METSRLNGALGARVTGIDWDAGLTPDDLAGIEATLYEHGVLAVAALGMRPEQHVQLAGHFGEFEHHEFFRNQGEGLEHLTVLDSDLGDRAWKLVLPTFTLGLVMVAYITRVTRSAMLQVLSEDYVRTARAKGVPARLVVRRHALRNALIPVVTVVGLYLGINIGNSVLTEIVFNRPGLGKVIVTALNQRDYSMLQGLMVIYCFLIVITNLLTDLTYGLIDPRVKQA